MKSFWTQISLAYIKIEANIADGDQMALIGVILSGSIVFVKEEFKHFSR